MTESSQRPWGSYTILTEGDGFKVKTIEVHPGRRLSYQKHSRRAEHWFVVAGAGLVTLDGDTVEVRTGEAIDIPLGAAHRIHNTGPTPLVFVEVQHGDYFGEDDIVRLEDDYGRAETNQPVEESV
ncbi:phosphomannose isomerase type II C-terminal cupin domain [Nocardia beijingensis]|uniref:phosphomannose isomerase type II C-terminal cupin domain n=1 Tax=Nocardia beijingensis TaxID=95162 RepID=UPI0033E10C33